MKWSSSNSLLHASISTKLSLPSVFSWKSTFSVFLHVLYHLYIIYISFIFDSLDVLFTSFTTSGVYSLRCFIDPLSPPSILHQLPPSFFSSPVVHFVSFFLFFSLRSLSLFFLSCFCAVADIYNHSDLLSFFLTPKVSLPLISSFPPLLFSSFVFHLEAFVFLLSCSAPSHSRGLLRWWTKAVCCRWSSTLSFSPRWVSWGCVQTLRGPRVFTSACKKRSCYCVCSWAGVTAERAGLNQRLMLLFDHTFRGTAVLILTLFIFIFLYQHVGKHRILGNAQEEVEISLASVVNPSVSTQLLITQLCGGNKSALSRSSQTSDPLTVQSLLLPRWMTPLVLQMKAILCSTWKNLFKAFFLWKKCK